MYILLIEADPVTADEIRQQFALMGDAVDLATDTLTGQKMIAVSNYDLVIVDILRTDTDRYDWCRMIRREAQALPILLLDGQGKVKDIVEGLDAGADDYLCKPFDLNELAARARAIHRRATGPAPVSFLKVADLEVDLRNRTARRSGREIPLSGTEFSLLRLLIIHKNQVLSKDDISRSVWGMGTVTGTGVINVYINYLRTKIDKGFDPPLIHTVIKGGYILLEPEN